MNQKLTRAYARLRENITERNAKKALKLGIYGLALIGAISIFSGAHDTLPVNCITLETLEATYNEA